MNKSQDYTMLNGLHVMQCKIDELRDEGVDVYAVDPETFKKYIGLLMWKYEKRAPDDVEMISYMGIDIVKAEEN